MLSTNEVRARAAEFAREWKDARYEAGEKQTFYDEFFRVFGMKRRQVATFEEPVKKLGGKRLHRLVLEGHPAGRTQERGPRSGSCQRTGARLLPESEARRVAALRAGQRLPEFRALRPRRARRTEVHACRTPAARRSLQFHPRQEEGRVPGSGPRQHHCRRACRQSARRARSRQLQGPRSRTLPRPPRLLPVRRRHRHFRAERNPSRFSGEPDQGRRQRSRPAAQPIVRCTEYGLSGPPKESGGRSRAIPIRQWRPVRRAAARPGLRQRNAGAADRSLRIQMGCDLARHFRRAVSVGDGCEGAALAGRPLYDRGQHPEGHPAAVSGCAACGVRGDQTAGTDRKNKLAAFHDKLANLTFFDPACGCGNFLIITYRELRRLEIELLKEMYPSGQQELDVTRLSRLDVNQFYGIEIEEFSVRVAETAMWMMDHIMNNELSLAFGQNYARIPLNKSANSPS